MLDLAGYLGPQGPREHCCAVMTENVNFRCDTHAEPFECVDHLIYFAPHLREYGLLMHDGGPSYVGITHCPWCGTELPPSLRDRWFDEIEARGINPGVDDIPAPYNSAAWYTR